MPGFFLKKSWIGDIHEKVSKLAQNQTLWYFSQKWLEQFWPEILNMAFNLNETYFSEKIAIWRYVTSKLTKSCPNWCFWPFSQLCIISFPCLFVFIQFDGPVNVFLFSFLHQFIDLKKKTRWQLIQSTSTNYKLCEGQNCWYDQYHLIRKTITYAKWTKRPINTHIR